MSKMDEKLLKVKKISFKLNGLTPAMMNDGKGANPILPDVMEMSQIQKKKNKTPEDYRRIAWLQFKIGMYFHPTVGPYIPADNIIGMIQAAAGVFKLREACKRGLFCLHAQNPMLYEGPRTLDEMWGDGDSKFVDTRIVTLGAGKNKRKVLRTRPIFPEWAVETEVIINLQHLTVRNLEDILAYAGTSIGILDYRPTYGQFQHEILSVEDYQGLPTTDALSA